MIKIKKPLHGCQQTWRIVRAEQTAQSVRARLTTDCSGLVGGRSQGKDEGEEGRRKKKKEQGGENKSMCNLRCVCTHV